ncbi:MAG: hypothetical protein IKZ91_00125 [Bacteroidales bacterium]|nr:hypothetical protein [Bacteroidales bacterium]
MRRLVLAFALLLASIPAAAQFYSYGNEPVWTRWRQITTPDYKVVYPEGLDSLARVYADLLERVKRPVGATAGYSPNQEYRKPFPVILHPGTASANGMVAWTPRRMELLTTPTYRGPEPTPWPEHLVVHESRHVAQMQFVNARPYRPYRVIIGDLLAGAVSSVYAGSTFYEGDAVAAETELTATGRGRSASFLEYYRAAFREGDMRNYWQWRYGSLKKFTPDYYKLGYIRAAGMRDVYGVQDFTARYYERLFRKKCWPWPMFNYPKTVKELTGKKFNEAFAEISDTLRHRWLSDELARAPFMPSDTLTATERHFTEYGSLCVLDSTVYAIRSGVTKAPELVCIAPGGKVRRLSSFAYGTSRLQASEALGRLYWSEEVADIRWPLLSYSEIWYTGPDGAHKRLTEHTRWYNPSISPDGLRLAVTEYPVSGGSALLIIDARSGEEICRYAAPDGLQLTESVWIGDDVLALGISGGGYGIYNAGSGYPLVFDFGHVTVKELQSRGGELLFTCDLTGVNELYCLSGVRARRLTSSPQGGESYCFTPGGLLLYSVLDTRGRHVAATPLAGLPEPSRADFSVRHNYELAPGLEAPLPVNRDSVIVIPQSQPYKRLANSIRVHSWAPVYVSYDAVDDLSFESILSSAGLGATAFFQNELSTLDGTIAYNAAPRDSLWSHRIEGKISYSGLFPKIEASFSVDTDPARLYFLQKTYTSFTTVTELNSDAAPNVPSINGSLLVYVPLNFSSGGVYRGLIPQLRLSVSNSCITHGNMAPMNRVSASLRGYVMSATPSACIYPRLGGGLEAGWSGRLGATGIFSPNAYLYGYGYLPGLMDTHGIRVTATAQAPIGEAMYAERYAQVLPRGMSSFNSLAALASTSPFQSRVTFDYAFPFLPLDWSFMSPVAYVRNLECTLHADGAFFAGGRLGNTLLSSAGADLCVVLGNLAWMPFDTRIGVSAYWNWGAPEGYDRYHIGMVFNVDM